MTSALTSLLERIQRRQAVVGVIGLGYVGLPLALLFEESGFPVIGFDVDPEKPKALLRGESYIRHLGAERVVKAFAGGRISATTDFDGLKECNAILVCVPTPLGRHREPDLSYVRKTAEQIAMRLRPGQLVVLESTTYPGTTREELLPRLSARGLSCGNDFFLAFSPEREDPGNEKYNTRNIPKIVGAIDAPSREAAYDLEAARWNVKGAFYDTACFLTQQAGEKALKSLLYYLGAGRAVLMTHSLVEMIEAVGERVGSLPSLLHRARQLDLHYIPSRYPNGLPSGYSHRFYGREVAEEAVRAGESILSAVRDYYKGEGEILRPDKEGAG